jgi:hypothetical protein
MKEEDEIRIGDFGIQLRVHSSEILVVVDTGFLPILLVERGFCLVHQSKRQ